MFEPPMDNLNLNFRKFKTTSSVKWLFLSIALTSLGFFYSGCSNSVSFEVESETCEVALSNFRYVFTQMNTTIPLTGGDSVYDASLLEIYVDYDGDCLDTNAYFDFNFDAYYIVDSTDYTFLNTGSYQIQYDPVMEFGGKIRFRVWTKYNSSEIQTLSIKGVYRAYDPSTGYVIKETNTIVGTIDRPYLMN